MIFAEYLCDLVERGIDEVASLTVDVDVDRFCAVLIADGTVLGLHRSLPEEFEPQRGEQGGGQLHLLHDVTEQIIDRFGITDERAHDSTECSTESWLDDRLVLFDQVLFEYRPFVLLDENDGHFVGRLKPNTNPKIAVELLLG